MSDDRIQPERHFPGPFDECVQPRRSFPPSRTRYEGSFGDRVFARRDFEFWDPATVAAVSAVGLTVLFDDMEEAFLDPADTVCFDLRVGDLVFVRHGRGLLGGHPAIVLKLLHGAAEVQHYNDDAQPGLVNTYLTPDLRIYTEPVSVPWTRGDAVLAYRPQFYQPPAPLWLPGIVQQVHDFPCVEIDFADGGQALVPASLIQPLDLRPGMAIFTRTEYWTHGVKYHPCRVLEVRGEDVLVQNDAGDTFDSHLSLIAGLPRGYELVDGKLRRSSGTHGPGAGHTDTGIQK